MLQPGSGFEWGEVPELGMLAEPGPVERGWRHSGIGWHTPASVHFGTAEEVRDQRAVTLADAYARHPERFGRRPRPPEIPQQAWINDPAKRRGPAPQTS